MADRKVSAGEALLRSRVGVRLQRPTKDLEYSRRKQVDANASARGGGVHSWGAAFDDVTCVRTWSDRTVRRLHPIT